MTTSTLSQRRPIGIDLFAGAGGLSLGFEQAGFDIAAAVEIDPIHCATHHHNFPSTATICASVVNLTGKEIRKRAALNGIDVDVVFGGAPCQGFSLIGKRALDDPRNSLVFHFVRIVSEIKPRYFVFENVKGLTLGKHAKFLQEFIATMDASGYDVVSPYQVLNAADYGVPQDRKRLFVVGARRGERLPSYPAAHEFQTTVQDAIGDLPDADSFDDLATSDSAVAKWTTSSTYAKRLRGMADDSNDFSHPRRFDPNMLTASRRTAHSELSRSRFIETLHGKTEAVSRFRKLPPDGLCNTIRAGTDSARGAFTSPRPIHPHLPRVITVREAARLHSYPDWFRFHATKWHGFRQIGNSVPPLLGRAVAAEIVKVLGISPKKPDRILGLGDVDLLTFDMGDASAFFNVPRNTIAQRIRKPDSSQQELWSNHG